MSEKNTCNFANCEDCLHKLMKMVGLVLMILALFLLVKTYGQLKENRVIGIDTSSRSTISVSGEGEVSAVPDIANFSFSVTEEAKTVEQAQKQATEKMNAVLSFLNEKNINESDIKTTSYNIQPRYEWWNKETACIGGVCPPVERQRTLVAYEVSQNIAVELKDISQAGDILVGIGSLEVSNLSGLNFDIDEKDALEREARQEAIEKAQEKAEQLAKDLGVKLVRIVSYSANEGNNNGSRENLMFMAKSADMASPELPVGENEIKSTVYLTYEIK